jgi:hypothetical protein
MWTGQGDHLGSTSVVANYDGLTPPAQPVELYKAWGESRYASGTIPTRYQFTGQFNQSYNDLGTIDNSITGLAYGVGVGGPPISGYFAVTEIWYDETLTRLLKQLPLGY